MKSMTITLIFGGETIIDEDDFDRVGSIRWKLRPDGYAHGFHGGRMLLLHRFIMNAQRGQFIDHVNGNKLDNRQANLRFCTHSQNMINMGIKSNNTSGYKGVSYKKEYGKWAAAISANNKRRHLGYFATPEEAYSVYCQAADELFGSFRVDPSREVR